MKRKGMVVYIAGPMTGYPQYNFPAFDRMASRLRDGGHTVVNPAELDDPKHRAIAMASPDGPPQTAGLFDGMTWGDFLARDVKLIADGGIEAIVCLPGWEKSKGARLETYVGHLSKLPIYTVAPVGGGLIRLDLLDLMEAWA